MSEVAAAFSDSCYIADNSCMRAETLGDVMLKLVLRRDPNKHIAEVSQHISTIAEVIIKYLNACTALIISSSFNLHNLPIAFFFPFFPALIVDQIQIELKLVDMARETAGGHKSYT